MEIGEERSTRRKNGDWREVKRKEVCNEENGERVAREDESRKMCVKVDKQQRE